MWWIGQTKNNIANIVQLYAFTKKKKKGQKVKQTITTIVKLL